MGVKTSLSGLLTSGRCGFLASRMCSPSKCEPLKYDMARRCPREGAQARRAPAQAAVSCASGAADTASGAGPLAFVPIHRPTAIAFASMPPVEVNGKLYNTAKKYFSNTSNIQARSVRRGYGTCRATTWQRRGKGMWRASLSAGAVFTTSEPSRPAAACVTCRTTAHLRAFIRARARKNDDVERGA